MRDSSRLVRDLQALSDDEAIAVLKKEPLVDAFYWFREQSAERRTRKNINKLFAGVALETKRGVIRRYQGLQNAALLIAIERPPPAKVNEFHENFSDFSQGVREHVLLRRGIAYR